MIHTCVNEDVPLQMVVGSECSIAVNTDVALGVLQAQRSIIIVNAENLRHQKKNRHAAMLLFSLNAAAVNCVKFSHTFSFAPPPQKATQIKLSHLSG